MSSRQWCPSSLFASVLYAVATILIAITGAAVALRGAAQELQVTNGGAQASEPQLVGGKSVFTPIDAPAADQESLRGTAVVAIDTAGDVAGIYADLNNQVHTFIRTAAGAFIAVEAPGASTNQVTIPLGFDSAGDLMGIYMDANGVFRGFLRSVAGKVTSFNATGAGTGNMQGTFPVAINASGAITGTYVDGNDSVRGFVRSAAGAVSTFLVPGQMEGTAAVSINASGVVAGAYADSKSVGHGFVRAVNGTLTTFSVPAAGNGFAQGTAATSIDSAGDVGGVYIDANNVGHGFVRLANGTIATFSAPGAGTGTLQGTYPSGFDSAGDLAGLYIDANNIAHGFIRYANGTITTFDAPGTVPLSAALQHTLIKGMAAGRSGKTRGFFNKTSGLLGAMGSVLGQSGPLLGARTNALPSGGGVLDSDGSVIDGTVGFAINPTGTIAGVSLDGEAVVHSFVRATNGALTVFDAPAAGIGVLQGTLAFTLNAGGTVAGTYVDQNSVFHGFVLALSQAATTIALTTSSTVAVFGQPITLTAKITSAGGVPANGQTVWFINGPATLGTQKLAAGVAALTLTTIPSGTNSITTVYGGDFNFAGSKSNAVTETVSKAGTATTLTSTPNPSSYGQLVTVTAKITGQYGGSAKGSVTFTAGTTKLGTAPVVGNFATLATSAIRAGTNAIQATYSGDTKFSPSTSGNLSQVVNKIKPTLTWATPAPIQYGTLLSAVQLNAIASTPGTFVYSPAANTKLAVGAQKLSVTFTPADAVDFITSPITASVTLQVNAAAANSPTVTVTPSLLSVKTTQILPVTVKVAGVSGKPTPTGFIVVTSGAYTSETLPLVGGSATNYIAAGGLAVGSDILTANFTPDAASSATYKNASGKSSAVTVSAGAITPGAAITLAVAPTTTVSAGSVVTLTATVRAGTALVTTGQVKFCVTYAATCTDINLLGMAQLTKAGTAVLKFRPGVGTHKYTAVFTGTKTNGASASSVVTVTVTHSGPNPSASALALTGSVGNYTLTATVGGQGLNAPAGTVSFLDTTYGNAVLKSSPLTPSAAGLNWTAIQTQVDGHYPGGQSPVVFADFNGDGIPDLAMGSYVEGYSGRTTSLEILLGNGDGTFRQIATPAYVLQGSGLLSFGAGDFNGDGIADLALVTGMYTPNPGKVTILLGKGDGTFKAISSNPSTGFNPSLIATADFNGDGIADLAVLNRGTGSGASVTILLGAGDGTFKATASPVLSIAPSSMAAADFNGDSKADLVVSGFDAAQILLGKGDGTFGTATTLPTGFSDSVATADFNGDGKTDLVFAGMVLLGKGDGTFKQGSAISLDSPTVADFNQDGIPDLVNPGSVGKILLGKGDGTFAVIAGGPAFDTYVNFLDVSDINGDGYPDLVVVIPSMSTANNSAITVELLQARVSTASVTAISVMGAGPHMVAASYYGDSDYNPSVSAPTPLYAPTPKPAISVPSGTYTAVKVVSITSTAGARIYYSTDGYPPEPGSNPYMGPITVSDSQTIMAIAVLPGYAPSPVASANYTIHLSPAATPVISVGSGVYASALKVTLSDATPGATIYYTTNGAMPTTASTPYTAPVTISTPLVLTALATAAGHTSSLAASAQYLFSAIATPMIYTVAGDAIPAYGGDGGPATTADLNSPIGVVADSAGNLYISDYNNNRIRKVTAATGVISTYAGTGVPGYLGDGGLAVKAQLQNPNRLAIDKAGNLYIPDQYNGRIRKITATGVITTIAGNGSAGCSGDNGLATDAGIGFPSSVAIDSAGDLYIATCNRIRKVTVKTNIITAFAGTGQLGYSGNGGPAIDAQLNNPRGIAFDSKGNLYIADMLNNVVRKVDAANRYISTFAGNGYGAGSDGTYIGGSSGDGGPATAAELFSPQGVVLDENNNLYICDAWNQKIRRVDTSGIITTVAGNGIYLLAGDGGPASSSEVSNPSAIFADGAGNLYFADEGNDVIRKIKISSLPPASTAPTPVFSVAAGTYAGAKSVAVTDTLKGASIHVTVDGTTPTAASPIYHGPLNVSGTQTLKAIAIAPGNLPSASASAAYTITAPSPVITTVAGSGIQGITWGGGPALNVRFGTIDDIAVDGKSNLYFADQDNNVVWKSVPGSGAVTMVAGNGYAGYSGDGSLAIYAQLNYPTSVAADSAGNLYIADSYNRVIRKVAASTGMISTIAGDGQCHDLGEGGPATNASLCYPTTVRLDTNNNLYIADCGFGLIREVDAKTGVITTVAGDWSAEGYGGDGGPATSAGIPGPQALALDKAGNLYIGEADGRVRKVTRSTGIISTFAGNGMWGYRGDGGKSTSATINQSGLAVDASGNLFIANWPATVRKVSAANGIISTVAGNGFCGYWGDGVSAAIAELCEPTAVAFDATGNLYIADALNFRIRKVTPVTPSQPLGLGEVSTPVAVETNPIPRSATPPFGQPLHSRATRLPSGRIEEWEK